MEEWPEKKSLLKNKKTHLLFAKRRGRTYGRRYSGQMRLKLSFLAIKGNAMSVTTPTPAQHPESPENTMWECFSSAGTGKLVRIEGMMDGTKYKEILEETCFSLPDI